MNFVLQVSGFVDFGGDEEPGRHALQRHLPRQRGRRGAGGRALLGTDQPRPPRGGRRASASAPSAWPPSGSWNQDAWQPWTERAAPRGRGARARSRAVGAAVLGVTFARAIDGDRDARPVARRRRGPRRGRLPRGDRAPDAPAHRRRHRRRPPRSPPPTGHRVRHRHAVARRRRRRRLLVPGDRLAGRRPRARRHGAHRTTRASTGPRSRCPSTGSGSRCSASTAAPR